MKKSYDVKSDRYGHTHKFVQSFGNNYLFKPEESWMPIYLNFDPATKKVRKASMKIGAFCFFKTIFVY